MGSTHLIHDSGVSALRRSLGTRVTALYSASVNVFGGVCTAPEFSMRIAKDRWIIVDNEWVATPEPGGEYYLLRVYEASDPKGIRAEGDMIRYPHSMVSTGAQGIVIDSVSIYESHKTSRGHRARYDSGIVFAESDGESFALTPERSISGLLVLGLGRSVARAMVEGMKLRITISK